MEWMLQVLDELDDAVGMLRQKALGVGSEFGLTLSAAELKRLASTRQRSAAPQPSAVLQRRAALQRPAP
jgi:hypothetical protein